MLAVSAVVAAYIQRPTKVVYEATTIHSTIMPKTIDEWDVLIMAMCEVESGSNPNAVGSKDDIGVLQITPIYVEEANRILGRDVYSLADRFNITYSLEMFEIVNSHHNPEKDVEKAIKLHNPNAPRSYRTKILNKIRDIKRIEAIRGEIITRKN